MPEPTPEQVDAARGWLLRHFEWLESYGPTVGTTRELRGIQAVRPMEDFDLAALLATREADAFVAGAEAMREAARRVCREEIRRNSGPTGHARQLAEERDLVAMRIDDEIHALPVPKERR